MLVRAPRPLARRLHASAVRAHLVGPFDPVSNLRPVVYDDDVPVPRKDVTHPYSLKEFTGDTREYQWKIQRQQQDVFNHVFWTDNNLRFEMAKSAVLSRLPKDCTVDEQEAAFGAFYTQWAAQEKARMSKYNVEWRKRNWSSILLGARLSYEKFVTRLSRPFSSVDQTKSE